LRHNKNFKYIYKEERDVPLEVDGFKSKLTDKIEMKSIHGECTFADVIIPKDLEPSDYQLVFTDGSEGRVPFYKKDVVIAPARILISIQRKRINLK
jgi:hypothetical protein